MKANQGTKENIMTSVSNDDRIAAALLRLEQAERLVTEARKIFSYAEKQQCDQSRAGLYPGQLTDPTIPEEETEECET